MLVAMATQPTPRNPILVAGSDLPAGVALSDLDLAVRDVIDPTGLIDAGDADRLAGMSLLAPVASGTPVPESLLVGSEAGTIAVVGLELESAAALHGQLRPGDRVDVYRVDDTEAGLIADGVQVLMVEVDDSALGLGEIRLLVGLDRHLAADLVAAGSSIHLVGGS
jgi:Flp pilus assembly protein CpaB